MPEMKLTWVMEATRKYAKVAPIQIRRSQGKLRLLKLSTMSATYSPMNPNTAPLHPTTYPTNNYTYSSHDDRYRCQISLVVGLKADEIDWCQINLAKVKLIVCKQHYKFAEHIVLLTVLHTILMSMWVHTTDSCKQRLSQAAL
jgi:hypothetical protein